MTGESISSDLSALEALLDAEHDALMCGDLDRLTGLLDTKEALIESLNAQEHNDLDRLRHLHGKVRRNQLLLNGALDGIHSVTRRMAALRRIRGTLETYDSNGRKRNIDIAADRSVEKRA